jgi:hypothetical protein
MAREKLELTEDDFKRIETMAGLGLPVDHMASILGMSKKTFERRMADTPGAIDALEKGRAVASQQVMATAYKMATSGKVPAMTMFWLKCRERWKETQAVEHSGPDGKPIETKSLSHLPDEELNARIAQLMGKVKGDEP